MKIALFQGPLDTDPPLPDVDRRLQRAADAARQSAAAGAQLLVLPEMFASGYNLGRERIAELAQPHDGGYFRAFAELARSLGIAILYGYPERDGAHVYNAAQLVDRNGTACLHYRKTHLFGDGDRACFTAGDAHSAVVDFEGFRVGLLICYDVEFPENARHLALAGANLIIVPTAQMQPYRFVPEHMIATRAFENLAYVVYANRCGREGTYEYTGLSCIAAPDGRLLAQAGTGEELLFATLEHAELDAAHQANTYLADRRPALYQTLTGTVARPFAK